MKRLRSTRGQAAIEYLMVLGMVTAMLIAFTGMLIPVIRYVFGTLVGRIAVYLTSPPA